MDADLVVEVDAVDEAKGAEVATLDLEDVHLVVEDLVALHEVLAETRELALDEAFDAGILNDIDEVLSHTLLLLAGAADLLRGFKPAGLRGVLGMGDLMTDQEVTHRLTHTPHGEQQGTGLEVERSRRDGRAVHHLEVLRSEEIGKDADALSVADGGSGVHGVFHRL